MKHYIELLKVAPFQTFLGLFLFLPTLLVCLVIFLPLAGGILETIVIFILYGLSGLDKHLEWDFYREWVLCCETILNYFIPFGGFGTKLFLHFPYAIIGVYFLIAADRKLEAKQKN